MKTLQINDTRNRHSLRWPCYYMFLVGTLMRIDVFILGRFALGEIFLLALIPFAFGSIGILMAHPFFRWLIISIGLWVFGALLSDIVNQSYFELTLRGLARPFICLFILISGHFLIARNPKSIIWFFIGLLFAGILNYIFPTDFRAEDITDGGSISYQEFAFVWTPLVYGIVSVGGFLLYRVSPILAGIFQIVCGLAAAPFFSRTTAAVFLISGLIVTISSMFPRLSHIFIANGRIKRASMFKFIIVGLVGYCIIYYVYAYSAAAGLLGEYGYNKFVTQSSSAFGNNPFGVLFTGRHYTLGAIYRIIEFPFFGAGSWPLAGDAIARAVETLGMPVNMNIANPFERDPGHSVFFGIWAQSGPLVLPFFVTILLVVPRLFVHVIFSRSGIKALMLVYFISFLFSFFFNNFNSLMRTQMMLYPLMYYCYIKVDARLSLLGNRS